MTPTSATNNAMRLLAADAPLRAKLHEGYAALCVLVAQGYYVLLGQFGVCMLFALEARQALTRVHDVLLVSQPLKVFHAIVARVEVYVVDFVRWCRLGADEGARYKLVHQKARPLLSRLVQQNALVAIFPVVRAQNPIGPFVIFASANTHDAAMIRDGVKTFKARDWLPNFKHMQLLIIAPLMKLRGSQYRGWFSRATLAAQGEF